MQAQRHQNEDEPVIEVTKSVSPVDEHVADLMSHTIDISALATAVTNTVAFSTLLGFAWIALQWIKET